ncbi:MAG: hypothetical protein LBQ60_02255 [Bacteroidales bacterium]|jgi:hypothetical protein|nr:hypothetical protein [Bacteroidales bacterium]
MQEIVYQADWRINKYLHLGLNPYFALRQKKGNNVGTHYMTSIIISPHFEMAAVGVELPIIYNQFKSFNVGFGLRLGALWLGSTNFFNMIASNKLREANLCIAFKVSIHHKK